MITALYDSNKPLYGLFDVLKERNQLSFVQLTGERNNDCNNNIYSLLDDNKKDSVFWYTTDNKPYIIITFKQKVLITSYTFQNAGQKDIARSYP